MKLPKGWEIVSLEKVAKIQTGLAKGKKDQKNVVSLPYLRVANVQDGYLDLSEIKEIEVDSSQVNRYLLQNEDILLTEGGDFDKLGRGGIWHCQINPCLHQNHVFAVRVNRENLIPYFFAQQVSSFYGKAYFLSCAKQTTNLASINSTQLKKFPVLLPPLLEQCKIVEILGIWDESIDLLERLIGKTRSRKQGLMQQLLTGKKRFKEFEGSEWKTVTFEDVLSIEIGGTPSRANAECWDNEKLTSNYWLSIADLKYKYINTTKEHITELGAQKSNAKLFPAGTVVMSFKLTIGKVAILSKPMYTNEAICSLIPKQANSINIEFLYQVIGIVDFDKEIDQAIKGKTLNKEKIKRLNLKLPPLPEQEKIAAVLSATDEQISTLEKQLAAYKQQKLGLMQQLLTGRIRI